VTDELSFADLEGELCAALPTRNLMGRRKFRFFRRSFKKFNNCDCGCNRGFGEEGFGFNRGFNDFNRGFGDFGGTSAFASFGSAANANSTFQSNINPQFSFGGGFISSNNENENFTNQIAAPFNFSGF